MFVNQANELKTLNSEFSRTNSTFTVKILGTGDENKLLFTPKQ
jgi:hypothetical protein